MRLRPSESGEVTEGEGAGDWLPKKPRQKAEGDVTQGEGRSLKGGQQGPLRGCQVKPPHCVTDPTIHVTEETHWESMSNTPYTHMCVQVLNKEDMNVPYRRPTTLGQSRCAHDNDIS